MNVLHKWLSNFSNYVDSQNGFIVDEVNSIHHKMIHWLVQALIRLAPDKPDLSEEAKKIVYDSSSSVQELEKNSHTISEKLEKFSFALAEYFIIKLIKLNLFYNFFSRCNIIITEDENNRKSNEESKYEKEFQNLQNFKNEVKEWNFTLKLMVSELIGDKSHRKILSDRLGHLSTAESREKSNLDSLNMDENDDNENNEEDEDDQVEKSENDEEDYNENDQNNRDNKNMSEMSPKKSSPKFEIIANDSNTEYKFLENLNFDESNDLSEQELKSTVFNAYKTIENLQNDLM